MTWSDEQPLAAPFAALSGALTEVLDSKASSFSASSAKDAVTTLLPLLHQAGAAYLVLLRHLDDLGCTPADVVTFLGCAPNHLSRLRAARDVEAAKLTDPSVVWDGVIGGVDGDRGALQHLGDALAAGKASRAHLDVAVRALAKIPTTIRRGTSTIQDLATGELTEHRNAELLDARFTRLSAEHDPGVVKDLARELVLTIDPDHDDRTYRDPDGYSRRGLVISALTGGMRRMTADLDETTALTLTAALTAEAAPRTTEVLDGETVKDPRTTKQRDVDALVSLVERGAAASTPGVAHGARVAVVATVADVENATQHRDRPCTATVEGRGPVSTSAFGYLVCGATLRRVLTTPAGAVLDLGRSARLATSHQRQVMALRDGGCVAPGCTTAAWACEAHHFPEWDKGGRTDLDTMALLCPNHHRAWHARHLEVRLRPDRTIEARWVHWDPRWPGTSRTSSWVRNTYPADRALIRSLGARLRDDDETDDDPPQRQASESTPPSSPRIDVEAADGDVAGSPRPAE